ncbi:ABC transporter permease [Isobaculum melis]|uniref:ABC-2 type transport system permease protein n=1 Tax=Isobaculum melis TaxID=142588 RepID=A0A1H9QLM7_9LACT|nr:ABC transporter permease [Isobaculum melis]SER60653.1 ABC-2 type transport system permease protein [Isobaculum melis]
MDMSSIWKERAALHQKKMARYLKYVFNDHFMLVVVILLGAAILGYADWVKSLSESFSLGKWLAVVVLFMSLFIGKVATLIEPPDAVFLLPLEKQISPYLKKVILHSLMLPGAILAFVTALIMPLLAVTAGIPFVFFFYFYGVLLLVKVLDLMLQVVQLRQLSSERHIQLKALRVGLFLSSVILLIVTPIMISLPMILALFAFVSWFMTATTKQFELLNWEKMVTTEQHRMHRIYQFINLFTDIPALKGKVKRRKYLDPLLGWIQVKNAQTYLYLYARTFIRGNEYSGLYVRLTGIAMLVSYFNEQFYLTLFISALLIYLTGFQLLPLRQHHEDMIFTHLYPTAEQFKGQALQRLMLILLVVEALFIAVASLFTLTFVQAGLLLGVNLCVALLFALFYVPNRMKK